MYIYYLNAKLYQKHSEELLEEYIDFFTNKTEAKKASKSIQAGYQFDECTDNLCIEIFKIKYPELSKEIIESIIIQ